MKVYEHLHFTGLFSDKQYRATIWEYTGFNPTLCQYILSLTFYFSLFNLAMPLVTWLRRAFLWVNQVYMVFNIALWGNFFEIFKNITVLITQLTIETVFRVTWKIQNQKYLLPVANYVHYPLPIVHFCTLFNQYTSGCYYHYSWL